MTNPYLDECRKLPRSALFRSLLFRGDPENRFPMVNIGPGVCEDFRHRLTRQYAWAIPNEAAIKAIAAHSPLIEIGAGTGYWAKLIAEAGADIIAFDANPPPCEANDWHGSVEPHFNVEVGSVEKIAEHPGRTLFLCWPPNADPMTTNCLDVYKRDVLLYVGEGDAATSWDERLESEWEAEFIDIPQWEGIRDYLMIFRRKRPSPFAATAP